VTRTDAPLGVPGVLSADELARTAAFIRDCQLPSGQIPWFPGGHCDPWNLVEAAMGLSVAGHLDEARAAYGWLARAQLGDGSWFNYYLGQGVKDARLDTNVCAYVAVGVFHYFAVTGDESFVGSMWPVVERAVEFVRRAQRADGTVAWSLDAQGRLEGYALLAGSSSVFLSLRCAVALARVRGVARPDWLESAGRLGHALAHHPGAFAPKNEFAMDWYYPVLCGALTGERAESRMAEGFERHVMEGLGVRCVSTNDWVTAAETAECALALDALGATASALEVFALTTRHRRDDGGYWTGLAYPDAVTFPDREATTYTAAAVLLGADALTSSTGGAGLFRHENAALPGVLDIPEPGCAR
jgi:MMP endo-(1,4)-3-O-methyl-alpha-D-mannosidase